MPTPVRFGLIGAGRWGRVYIRTLQSLADRCRLTHLCTRDPKNAGLVPHPIMVMSDWRGLVASDCEAVIVATPPQTHAEIVEACVAAGKPCLVEKPLCLDVETAERLHRRIQSSGVPVLVAHTYLVTPGYRMLKQTLRERGEPVRAILSEGMAFGPFRTHLSALWDWCPHDVSLCLDLLGATPQRVEALGGPCSPQGEPDMVSVRLEFPGSVAAWIHAGRLSVQKRRRFSVATDTRLYLFDDQASDTLTVAPVAFAARYTDGIPDALEWSSLNTGPEHPSMVHVVTDFLDGLAGGDRSRFGAKLALEVTRVLSACEQAIKRSGR